MKFNCGKDYQKATSGRHWKTAGDDVQYEIVDEGDIIYVHYQCSTSDRDWKNNFKFIPKRVKMSEKDKVYVWIHRGFWNAFISAWSTIYQEILDVIKTKQVNTLKYIVFDGHSFGGAMANISFLMWNRQQKIKSVIETWGAPKCIFNRSCIIISDLQANFVCNNDLVPRMPPFYKRYPTTYKVGEKFNLFKMLTKMEHYHTSYAEYDEEV